MSLLIWMQPRDNAAAARTASALSAVALGVTIVFAPIAPTDHALRPLPLLLAAAVVVAVALLIWTARVFDETKKLAWALCPLLAVAAIVALNLAAFGASVPAQIYFLFPVLYGASRLRPPGAVVMTAASLVGEIVVVAARLPAREAVADAGYVAAALVTTAVLLSRASQRQATLVESLERQSAIDPLTGLVTRRVLDAAATSALSRPGNHEGTVLILLDVDDFKSVNDSYGHQGGDQVLVQIAELLVRDSRRGDVVCRMGGDEVAFLLPGCSADSGRRRAELILSEVRDHDFSLSGADPVNISVSVGLAHSPSDTMDLRSLYAAADAALLEAKRSGRNQVAAPGAP